MDDAAERVKAMAGGPAPRWAVMVRAGQLRGEGVAMKELPREKSKGAVAAPLGKGVFEGGPAV